MKILPARDRQTGGWVDRHEETYSCFSQFCKRALKNEGRLTGLVTSFLETAL